MAARARHACSLCSARACRQCLHGSERTLKSLLQLLLGQLLRCVALVLCMQTHPFLLFNGRL